MSIDLLDGTESSEVLSDSEWTTEETGRQQRRRSLRSFDISSSMGPVMVPFADGKLVFSEPPPDWFRQTLERICALGTLQSNWDSYGARPVDPRCAVAAIRLLLSILKAETPTPSVVPTPLGGVQIEWHRSGVDLEIEVKSPSRFHVVFEDEGNGEVWEQTITSDLQPLVPALERLTATD